MSNTAASRSSDPPAARAAATSAHRLELTLDDHRDVLQVRRIG